MAKIKLDEKDVKEFFEGLNSDRIKSFFCLGSNGMHRFGAYEQILKDIEKAPKFFAEVVNASNSAASMVKGIDKSADVIQMKIDTDRNVITTCRSVYSPNDSIVDILGVVFKGERDSEIDRLSTEIMNYMRA